MKTELEELKAMQRLAGRVFVHKLRDATFASSAEIVERLKAIDLSKLTPGVPSPEGGYELCDKWHPGDVREEGSRTCCDRGAGRFVHEQRRGHEGVCNLRSICPGRDSRLDMPSRPSEE